METEETLLGAKLSDVRHSTQPIAETDQRLNYIDHGQEKTLHELKRKMKGLPKGRFTFLVSQLNDSKKATKTIIDQIWTFRWLWYWDPTRSQSCGLLWSSYFSWNPLDWLAKIWSLSCEFLPSFLSHTGCFPFQRHPSAWTSQQLAESRLIVENHVKSGCNCSGLAEM